MARPSSPPGPVTQAIASAGRPGFEEDLGQLESGQRGVAGRFDDDRIAAGDRRTDFVRNEDEGKVERCDRGDDAARDAERESEFPSAMFDCVERDHFPGEPHGFLRRSRDDVGGASGLSAGFGQRLALFAADRTCQIFDAFAHQSGGPVQDLRAAMRRESFHRRFAGLQRRQGGVNIGRIRVRDGVDGRTVEGVQDVDGLRCFAPFTGDEHSHGEAPLCA